MSAFSAYVGIDQTGAVRANGTPRPLRAAMFVRETGRLVTADLPSASQDVLSAWARDEGVPWSRLAILIDAVIGLPAACWPSWTEALSGGDRPWSLFVRASGVPGWGRGPGTSWFSSLLERDPLTIPSAELPRRACEELAGANSVFLTRPFQKNVQTGTFRLWKDLASSPERWANVWAFDRRAVVRGPWLFEGYPSLLWWRVFGHRRRAPARFREVVAKAPSLGVAVRAGRALVSAIEASPDVADAAVLALGAACLDVEGRLLTPFRFFERDAISAGEGWIVGLPGDRE